MYIIVLIVFRIGGILLIACSSLIIDKSDLSVYYIECYFLVYTCIIHLRPSAALLTSQLLAGESDEIQ